MYIQKTDFCAQPGFNESKPPCLASLQDSSWEEFHTKVHEAASKMWSDLAYCAVVAIVVQIGFLGLVLLEPILGAEFGMLILLGCILGPRFWFITHNQAQDAVIRQACAELTSELVSTSGMTVHYRTEFVGFCRRRGEHPFRAIAIAPKGTCIGMGTVAGQGQLMRVQVPEGAGPGTTLQVQSPSGQQIQVAVPPGVSAGQVFQVQVPAVVSHCCARGLSAAQTSNPAGHAQPAQHVQQAGSQAQQPISRMLFHEQP